MNDSLERGAVLIPGGMYGTSAPLLMYSGDAALARGARLERVEWSRPDEPRHLDPTERGPWVLSDVDPVLDRLTVDWPAAMPVLVGKSLGSYAAAAAASRGLPAIWLTPVLTDDWVPDALRRASAPCLLVGGTADPLWDGALARQLSPYVLEVDDADHGMYVPGPLAGSARVLGRVVTAVEEFLDEVVWPASDRPASDRPA